MSRLNVDLRLVEKYNVPGPRYTSYPPATHFTNQVPGEALREKIRECGASNRDLSLYFHLPFCRSLCWYCGCTTVITTRQDRSAVYLDYLARELELTTALLKPGRKVVQIHLGGGTPTFLLPGEIGALGELIRSHFTVADDVEASVEIDPRRLTHDHVSALRDAGFNRASVGVQDYDEDVQRAVHRLQSRQTTERAVHWLREAGFESLNIDLMYGLPFQTVESFERTLEEVLKLSPDRLAVFNYAHVPWLKPAQKRLREEMLPAPAIKLQLLKLTIEKLTSQGYVYIGMDHFVRENDEMALAQRQKTLQRNFQGYSTCGGADLHAFGMSAISQADGIYWQNHKELPAYYSMLDQRSQPVAKAYFLTEEDKLRRQTIMRLMCDLSLDFAGMSRSLNVDFKSHFASELASLADLEADGLVTRTSGGLEVTDLGRLLIRNIAMRFDAYLPAAREGRYSKTI